MHRLYAYGVSLALLVVMAYPGFIEPLGNDSFPNSTYPMFSTQRPTQLSLTHAVGWSEEGERVPLSPMVSSGNRTVLQSGKIVRRGVHHDPAGTCAAVAERVAAEPDLESIQTVELSTDRFDIIAYFEEAAEPIARDVHVRCEVPR